MSEKSEALKKAFEDHHIVVCYDPLLQLKSILLHSLINLYLLLITISSKLAFMAIFSSNHGAAVIPWSQRFDTRSFQHPDFAGVTVQ